MPSAPTAGIRWLTILAATVALGGLLSVTFIPVAAQGAPAAGPIQTAQSLIGDQKYDSAATILETVVRAQPASGQAWILLGTARGKLGQIDSAAQAYRHALPIAAAHPRAVQALFLLYAEASRPDDAYRWLKIMRQGGAGDLTSVSAHPEVTKLRNDQRFAMLFPDKVSYAPPFVEAVKIIHEWRGEAAGDEFGWIARAVGDVDHDGVTDVVISATQNPPFGAGNGKVYVYSGRSGALIWKQEGPKGALLGTGLESAGDVDGDGVPDVVAGAPGINSVFVFSGRDSKELLRLPGDSTETDLGSAASGIGDFDGDGHADIIASAPSSNAHGAASGRVYVFSGKDGHRLLTLDGENPGDGFGSTVGGGGGKYFIVGATGGGTSRSGRVYVYTRLDSHPAFVEEADSTGNALGGMFVSVAGDVDGDGIPDVYATDFSNTARGPATGRAYVYSGRTGRPLLTLTGEGPGEGFGIGAGHTGDVDGDGHDDLIVGAWQYAGAAWSGGRVTVYSGKDGKPLETFTGKVPGETLGFDAVGIGDIDGDGKTDYLITSAWSMVNGLRSGRVYVVAGQVGRGKR
jgi:hypothetical protein